MRPLLFVSALLLAGFIAYKKFKTKLPPSLQKFYDNMSVAQGQERQAIAAKIVGQPSAATYARASGYDFLGISPITAGFDYGASGTSEDPQSFALYNYPVADRILPWNTPSFSN